MKENNHKKDKEIEENEELNQEIENFELENKETENQELEQEEGEKNAYDELEDMMKRKVAEFENFKRRIDKEKAELLEYGNMKMMNRFVDLLDDLQNAEIAAQNASDIASVQKGIEMVKQRTFRKFEEEGVKQIEVNIGDKFDVEKHEALMQQNSDLPAGTITMIMQPGYTYKDKVLRHAKVATSAGENSFDELA
jgi:molecular chaperone GrpE